MATDHATQSPAHPHLRQDKTGTHLIVNGSPFLILGGETHNSAFSSARFLTDIWPMLKKQGFNTLLGAVTWEQIEPEEGTFDFSVLDEVILAAREHGMHIVLLWFGGYKNAVSTYVPGWVKRDSERFPRVRSIEAGGAFKILDVVSPLSEECVNADANAFGMMLAHLKEFDADHSTVVMVQVENEVGILGDSRDRSALAEAAFGEPVPEALLRYLASDETHSRFKARFPNIRKDGEHSWDEVFGAGEPADEAFMAYHFARYVGRVTESGKASYQLPLYANVWLNFDSAEALDIGLPPSVINGAAVAGGMGPGRYPSGGPCPHVLDIWRFAAPSLDFIAPDSYLHNYEMVCKDYTELGNPLFIPEQRRDAHGARRMWLALGTYSALGVSPWGPEFESEPVGREYKLLSQVRNFILAASPAQRFGFFFDELADPKLERSWNKTFGEIEVIVDRVSVFGTVGAGGGMVIQTGEDTFLLVGYGFQARFKGTKKTVVFTGILSSKEMEAQDGQLVQLRRWNGDEIRGGSAMAMPNEEPHHGEFPIPACIPARTGITEVKVYTLEGPM